MTQDINEQIATMQAARDGAVIETRYKGGEIDWTPVTQPEWDWAHYEYRVQPRPDGYYWVWIDGVYTVARHIMDKWYECGQEEPIKPDRILDLVEPYTDPTTLTRAEVARILSTYGMSDPSDALIESLIITRNTEGTQAFAEEIRRLTTL